MIDLRFRHYRVPGEGKSGVGVAIVTVEHGKKVDLVSWQRLIVGWALVRMLRAFLWSRKSLEECSLSGLYCLSPEGKTDKEGLDHRFGHKPITPPIRIFAGYGRGFLPGTRASVFRHPGEPEIGHLNEVTHCTRTGFSGLPPTRYLSKAQNINSWPKG